MGKLTSKGKHTVKVGIHPHTNMISKPEIVGRGEHKCRILEMHLKLRDQQVKILLIKFNKLCVNIDCYVKTSWEPQTKNLQ